MTERLIIQLEGWSVSDLADILDLECLQDCNVDTTGEGVVVTRPEVLGDVVDLKPPHTFTSGASDLISALESDDLLDGPGDPDGWGPTSWPPADYCSSTFDDEPVDETASTADVSPELAEEGPDATLESDLKKSLAKIEEDLPHLCGVCGRRFKTAAAKGSHIHQAHTPKPDREGPSVRGKAQPGTAHTALADVLRPITDTVSSPPWECACGQTFWSTPAAYSHINNSPRDGSHLWNKQPEAR